MNPATMRLSLGPALLPWLTGLFLLVLGAVLAEGLVRGWWLRRGYDWRAGAASIGDALLRRAVEATGLTLAAPVVAWAWAHRVATLPLATPWALLLLILGQEFCYYWFHRASHRVRWFWASHAVHHSPNELTLAAALRLGFTGKLTGTVLFFVPLVWLGFAPLAVFGALTVNLLYQFWLHAPWLPRLGPVEWIFNTPTHHKVHHASNPAYLDCNYGGALIVFDRLFGTFRDLRADEPPRYGLTTPLFSYNPLRIATHEWIRLWRDMKATPGWRRRLSVLLGPP